MSRLQGPVLLVASLCAIFAFNSSAVSQTSIGSLKIDTTSSTNHSAAYRSIQTRYFSTTSPNDVLLAFVALDSPNASNGNTVISASGAGLTWELVTRANGAAGDSEIWRAFAPSILSNV